MSNGIMKFIYNSINKGYKKGDIVYWKNCPYKEYNKLCTVTEDQKFLGPVKVYNESFYHKCLDKKDLFLVKRK